MCIPYDVQLNDEYFLSLFRGIKYSIKRSCLLQLELSLCFQFDQNLEYKLCLGIPTYAYVYLYLESESMVWSRGDPSTVVLGCYHYHIIVV